MLIYINKLFKIIGTKYQKYFYILIFMMILSGLLETIGIGLLLPIISFLVEPDQKITIYKSLNFMKNINLKSNIYLFLSLIFILYLFKGFFLVVLHRLQVYYINLIKVKVTMQLFKSYMSEDFLEFKNLNTNLLLEKITKEITVFTNTHLNSLLSIIVETFLIIFIVTFLLYLQPLSTLLIITITSIFGIFFYYFSKKRLNSWGKKRVKIEGRVFNNFKESFYGFVEIKINNSLDYFSNLIFKDNKKLAKFDVDINTLQILPKNLLEIIAVFSLILILILSLSTDQNYSTTITIISLFGLAAFKIIPSVSRLSANVQNFIYTKPSFNLIFGETKLFNQSIEFKEDNIIFEFDREISFKNVSFSYDKSKNFNQINNVSFSIPHKKVVGIIGESGSGKSTLINLILGFLKPSTGLIMCDSKEIKSNSKSWLKKIGYVSQNIHLIEGSLKSNIAYGIKDEDVNEERINISIDLSGLKNFILDLPNKINTSINEMGSNISGGQKQRICLARALYKDPEILILDEATNSLDFELEDSILENLKKLSHKKTIILVTHNIKNLKYCDLSFRIKNGVVSKNS